MAVQLDIKHTISLVFKWQELVGHKSVKTYNSPAYTLLRRRLIILINLFLDALTLLTLPEHICDDE